MIVELRPRASAQAAAVDVWWRANRSDAADAFTRELDDALDLLARAPEVGAIYSRRTRGVVRRVLLPTTQRHVYYVVDAHPARVVVLAIWGAVRGRSPPLR